MSKYVGKIITNQAPAGYSVFFDGTGDYLTVADNTALEFGSSDFTVEAWFYFSATPNSTNAIVQKGGTGTSNLEYFLNVRPSSNTIEFSFSTNGTTLTTRTSSSVTIAQNTWYHVAVARTSATLYFFLNGISAGTAALSSTLYAGNADLGIGASGTGANIFAGGYISNLRILKGTALYTANFTPPTQLFPITNTSLLTCQSPSIIDNSSNAFAITVNGNAAPSTFTPFVAYNPAPTTANPLVPAPGVWTLDEALQYTQQGVWPSPITNAIEDVFSTYLYVGNSSTQTITNGIDLAGKGGLIWLKNRSQAANHILTDTARGYNKQLRTNETGGDETNATLVTAFNSNGFSLGVGNSNTNASPETYVSWTFREQAKFFDVVTFTAQSSGTQTINHNLGSAPGCIILKSTSAADNWVVYHRTLASTQYLQLNTTDAALTQTNMWPSVTSTSFDVSIGNTVTAGRTYVAYLFAHNAGGFGPAGTDNVISCGSFVGTGGIQDVSLGYEPQWLLFKNASSGTANWTMVDNMRGWGVGSSTTQNLFPNLSNAETNANYPKPTSTGFQHAITAGDTAIYIAIRRGPMRPPTTGTSVFFPLAVAQADTPNSSGVPFPPDLVNTFSRNGNDRTSGFTQFQFLDRLRSLGIPVTTYNSSTGVNAVQLISSSNAAENAGMNVAYVALLADSQNITRGSGWNSASYGNWLNYFWRRAPGFLDVVCYTGTGANRTVSHNLAIAPEMMIVKRRNSAASWQVYVNALGNTNYLILDSNAPSVASSTRWNNTTPTASAFTVGTDATVNASGGTYVAYLFATVGGVSKVGSYTGTGALQTINCGFSSGARFVLIKRSDVGGSWFVWDSARGITSGNDPYLLLENTAAEVTNTNYVDTASTGFQVTAAAPAGLNAVGGTYIFLAIA